MKTENLNPKIEKPISIPNAESGTIFFYSPPL